MANPKSILFVTTADTDLLTAGRALEGLPPDFAGLKAFNPAFLKTAEEQQQLILLLHNQVTRATHATSTIMKRLTTTEWTCFRHCVSLPLIQFQSFMLIKRCVDPQLGTTLLYILKHIT